MFGRYLLLHLCSDLNFKGTYGILGSRRTLKNYLQSDGIKNEKKNIIGDTFFNSTTYLFAVCLCFCHVQIYSPSSGLIWTLKVPMDLLSPGGGNKIICKVPGQEIKIFYY